MKHCYIICIILFSFPIIPELSGTVVAQNLNCRERIEFPCFEYTSQTFMFTHPIIHNIAMYEQLWHRFTHTDPICKSWVVQCIGAYQSSISNAKVARYFLLKGKNIISVRGDTAPGTASRDIRAEWLGINNPNFSGYFSLSPEQKQGGIIVEVHHPFAEYESSVHLLKYAWLDIRLPIVTVQNNMQLVQFDVTNPGTQYPHDIIEAFNQPAWSYAKIKGISSDKTSLAEVNIHLGINYLAHDGFEISYYLGLSIPGATAQNPTFLFSPFIGNNGHFSFESGAHFQLVLNCDTTCSYWCLFVNLENHFLIPNIQCRTFDLKEKEWSRYLLYNHIDGLPDQNIPGVNILTQQVKARPYSMVDFSLGLRYSNPGWELEMGYNIWGHSDEYLDLQCPFPPVYGIAGQGSSPDNPGHAASASKSTIAQQAPNDPTFVTISTSDLNLGSGAARSAINHKAHLALGYTKQGKRGNTFCGLGAFYESPQKNSALELWGIWLKWGTEF